MNYDIINYFKTILDNLE